MVLQVLANTTGFVGNLLAPPHQTATTTVETGVSDLVGELRRILAIIRPFSSSERLELTPSSLIPHLPPPFNSNKQQDAAECFTVLLHQLAECQGKHADGAQNAAAAFAGLYSNTSKCGCCGVELSENVCMRKLELKVPEELHLSQSESCVDVVSLLDNFFAPSSIVVSVASTVNRRIRSLRQKLAWYSPQNTWYVVYPFFSLFAIMTFRPYDS